MKKKTATVRAKNDRKNMSFKPKDYLYIKKSAKKRKKQMTPYVLSLVVKDNLKDTV